MAFTAADVKKLREATQAGMMECKKALDETDGVFDKAVELLRVKGAAKAEARAAERETEGEPGSDNTRRERSQTHCILSLRTDSVGRFRLIRCTVRAAGCLARIASQQDETKV